MVSYWPGRTALYEPIILLCECVCVSVVCLFGSQYDRLGTYNKWYIYMCWQYIYILWCIYKTFIVIIIIIIFFFNFIIIIILKIHSKRVTHATTTTPIIHTRHIYDNITNLQPPLGVTSPCILNTPTTRSS